MDASALIDHLTVSGLTVVGDGDALVVSPASRLTDELRALIRSHKPALLAVLAHPQGHPPTSLVPAARGWLCWHAPPGDVCWQPATVRDTSTGRAWCPNHRPAVTP